MLYSNSIVDSWMMYRYQDRYYNIVKIINSGLYFIFSFHFIFLFLFLFIFSIFRATQVRVYQSCCHISHKLMAKSQDWSRDLREWSRRFWNKVTSYSMDNTRWPHSILMVIQGRVHSSQHGPWIIVYKVDYFVLGTLSSSLVSLNTRVSSLLKHFEH